MICVDGQVPPDFSDTCLSHVQDLAFRNWPAGASRFAVYEVLAQLNFNHAQFLDALPHGGELSFGEIAGLGTVQVFRFGQMNESSHLIERETQFTVAAHKYEPLHIAIVIAAVATIASGGFWQNSDFFVIADVGYWHIGAGRQITDSKFSHFCDLP